MSLTIMRDLVQGTEEWHNARRGLVTASAVGQLLTVTTMGALDYDCPSCDATAGNPCLSRARKEPTPIATPHKERVAEAAARKSTSPPVLAVADNDTSRRLTDVLVTERITGWTEPTYISDDMLRGIADEPRAIEHYRQHHGPVDLCGFMVLERDGWRLGFSPDGLVGDDGLIECKSRRSYRQVRTFIDDEVPLEVMPQLQAGLLVSGRAWVDYVAFAGGLPMYVKRVYPDPAWQAVIVAAVEAFEQRAAELVAAYEQATRGLPITERAANWEVVI